MEKLKQTQTYEYRKSTKNGVKRLVLTGIALLFQILLVLMFFTGVNYYAKWINTATMVIALVLVLAIYSQNKTSTMKMPWIIFILALPALGVTLYLLVGLDFSTYSMRRRYKETDELLLPHLPENAAESKSLAEICSPALGISHYLQSKALYPVYQNTDITYYDNAADALEAQLWARLFVELM
ncbi:MAG: PLD nuclease N-terminal domain-containing protein [Clostridia bacterium]|nr:PLD nuclease N-terminal domain-containing protein [Clostridia bacterium]